MRGRGGKTEVNDRGVGRFSPPAFSHVPQAQLNTNVSMHEIEGLIQGMRAVIHVLYFPFSFFLLLHSYKVEISFLGELNLFLSILYTFCIHHLIYIYILLRV